MRLKDKILHQMVRNGLNGQKLARMSEVSDSEISRILAGKSRPGLENAFRLARALGVSLDYLADDTLEHNPVNPPDPLSGEDRELLEISQAIGPSRAARILENVRIIGYENAMRRLLDAKPLITFDEEDRPASSATSGAPSQVSANRVNSG